MPKQRNHKPYRRRPFSPADQPAIVLADRKVLYGNGCDKAPDCFTCPLVDCRLVVHNNRQVAALRAVDACRMRDQGMDADEIASVLGISPRSVKRYLQPP